MKGMPDFVEGLHDLTDKQAALWPKFIMRPHGRPWGDGVVFIRCDAPGQAKYINAQLEVQSEGSGAGHDAGLMLTYSWMRRQVSPLYALARAAILSGAIK